MPKYLVILHDAQDNSAVGREELKLRLCDALKVSEPSMERLLSSLPVILRRDLELSVAEKYAETLEKLGAVVEAIEQVDHAANALAKESAPQKGGSELRSSEEFGLSFDAAPPAPTEKRRPAQEVQMPDPSHDAEINDLENLLEQALHSDLSQEDLFLTPPDDAAIAAEPRRVEAKSAKDPQAHSAAPAPSSAPPAAATFAMEFEASEPSNSHRESLLFEMMAHDAALPSGAAPQGKPAAGAAAVAPESQAAPDGEAPVVALPQEAPVERPRPSASAFAPSAVVEEGPAFESTPVQKRSYRDVLLFGGAILLLLFLAQPLIFRALGLQSEPGMNVFINIDSLLKEQKAILNSKPDGNVQVKREITGEWIGEANEGGVKATLKITEVEKQLAFVTLEVTTDRPPKITPEELVQGKPLPVWLRRFETKNLRRTVGEKDPPDAIAFRGTGRAYLEDGIGSDRIVVEGTVVGTSPADGKDTVEVQWSIARGMETQPTPAKNEVSRLNEKDFRLYFTGAVELRRQPYTAPVVQLKPQNAEVSHRETSK